MGQAVQYRAIGKAKTAGKGGWRTIGGGASAFIDESGRITAGCPGLVEDGNREHGTDCKRLCCDARVTLLRGRTDKQVSHCAILMA